MTYEEVLVKAKENIGPKCKVCPTCNGLGCENIMPGPGSKAPGNGAFENFQAWRKIKLNMDAIGENCEPDTSTELFGKAFAMPFITAPIGSIKFQVEMPPFMNLHKMLYAVVCNPAKP